MIRYSVYFISLVTLLAGVCDTEDKYLKLTCAVHIHSSFSGFKKTGLNDIVDEAKRKNIDVIIPTDHDIMRIEYGLPPLRNIIRKTYELDSVLKAGPQKYLDELSRLQKQNPEIIIIPGVESTPFYYWSGSLKNSSLLLNNWHKHMLIFGLTKVSDYKKLPLVSNHSAEVFDPKSMWPILIIIASFMLKKYRTTAILISILFLVNNFSFTVPEYDQYHGQQGEKPYQKLINYVDNLGGAIFWAHPEAPNYNEINRIGPVSIQTVMYPESLLHTFNYTGFAYFQEGYKVTGFIGGIWDKTLLEYCSGKREKPVWTIGELDYGSTGISIDAIKNILFVKDKNYDSALNAIKNGNLYVVNGGSKSLQLDNFRISSGKREAILGQTTDYNGPVKVFASISCGNILTPVTIKMNIVKNGVLVQTIETKLPAHVAWEDKEPLRHGLNYYRIEINANNSLKLITNPVFVKFG